MELRSVLEAIASGWTLDACHTPEDMRDEGNVGVYMRTSFETVEIQTPWSVGLFVIIGTK